MQPRILRDFTTPPPMYRKVYIAIRWLHTKKETTYDLWKSDKNG